MPIRSGCETFTASFRKVDVGGPVIPIDAKEYEPIRQALDGGTARGLVLLVHGYNNTRKDGNDAYEGFFARQSLIAQLPANRPLADNKVFVEVFWAGDADWGIASFLFYMGAVGNARETGKHFADLLQRLAERQEPLDVQVIGHSLGCRVVFEMLRPLIGVDKLRVTHAVFMAAAVPLMLIEDPSDQQRLRHAYDGVMRRSQGTAKSLYSPEDVILTVAFPAGQTLAKGDEGFMPVALGRDLWAWSDMPNNFSQYYVRGADHSDYWGWKQQTLTQADDAQRQVHEFLGFNAGAERRTAARDSGVSREPGSRETAIRPGAETR